MHFFLRAAKDGVRAFIELWSKTAELGLTMALSKLGVAYYYGQGMAQDKATGIRFSQLGYHSM